MKPTAKETVLFGMLGALMFALKKLMEFLPNIHLLGVFIIALTVVYRKKALYPIYIYVFLDGLIYGFAPSWIPYLYIWALLWLAAMLLPKNLPEKYKPLIYMTLCGMHGLLFGTLYAPVQALIFGFDFQRTVAWIIAGIPWDLVHGISNFACGILIVPLIKMLKKSEKYITN